MVNSPVATNRQHQGSLLKEDSPVPEVKEVFTLRVTREMANKIRKAATIEKLSINRFIAEAVEDRMQGTSYQKGYEEAKKDYCDYYPSDNLRRDD